MAGPPSDLVDPSQAFEPPAGAGSKTTTAPSDLVDPSQANVGGGAPALAADDSDSTAGAFGYGVIKGIPGGSTIASHGVPIAMRIGNALNWLKGGPNADQIKAMGGVPQDADAASAALSSKGKAAAEEHPWLYTAGTALPMALAPGSGSVAGAAGYGGALGVSEGVDEGDSYAGIATKGVLGAAGGGLGAAAINKVVPVFGDATRKAVLEAAQRLNTTMPRFAASTSPLVKRAGMIGFSVPGMSTPIEEATHASVSGMGAAAEQTAAGATKQTAGEAASTGLKDWIGPTSQGEVDAYYNRANAAMNQSAKTPLYTTQSIASQIAQRRQAAGISGTGGAVDHVMDALRRPGGLTYNGIKDLRSSVGEMMNQSILPQGMSGAELKQIYSGLSTDLDRAAYTAGGQQGLQLHNAANAFAKQTADRRDQLSALLGGPKAGASDEAVFQALKTAAGKTGGADIDLLRKASTAITPQSWDHVARGMVSTLGRDADGNFSPQRFITDYGKISDDAKGVLFGQNPQLRQNLDDLHTVSSQWKSLYKYANPSGTAGHGAGIGMAIEGWRHPLKTLGLYLTGSGVGKLLATPAGAGGAANFVRAVGSGNLNAIRDAATRVSATAGAQFGARVDPMALAALAMERPWEGEGGEHGAGDTGGGGQPQ
jgi:hypothetical protein